MKLLHWLIVLFSLLSQARPKKYHLEPSRWDWMPLRVPAVAVLGAAPTQSQHRNINIHYRRFMAEQPYELANNGKDDGLMVFMSWRHQANSLIWEKDITILLNSSWEVFYYLGRVIGIFGVNSFSELHLYKKTSLKLYNKTNQSSLNFWEHSPNCSF